MLQLKKLFLLFLLLWGLSVQAQTRLLKGRVHSQQGPVAGATVSVSGTGSGTASDNNGNFSLQVPEGNITLLISSVGYSTISKAVKPEENDILINLGQQDGELEKVVVTAL